MPVRASLDQRGAASVRIEQTKPSGLPRGASITHTWAIDAGSDMLLRCTMEVRAPGRSPVAFEMSYTRQLAKDYEPKQRVPQNPPGTGKKHRNRGGGGEAKSADGGPSMAAEAK